jgi:polysaccharide biosynthesis protein PslH
MKKILLICQHYPLPEVVGTNIRTMNFVRFFQEYGTIDVAYSHILSGGKGQADSLFSREIFLERATEKSFPERLLRWSRIRERPLFVPTYDDDAKRRLFSLIESNDYDYILVRYAINAWDLFKLPLKYRMRTVIDYDDIMSGSLYESAVASADGYFRKCRLRLNRRFLMKYEKKCLDFGASLFCSDEDMAGVIGNNGKGNAFVVPNVYNNKSFEDHDFGDGFLNENVLLFVGALMYKPNVDGLKWFIKSIYSEFKRKVPDAKLMIVGRSPGREVRELCENSDGVELHGDVQDVREYYKKCRVVVVPVLNGGGTRIKILEAALANRPVLSTPLGASGLHFTDGDNIVLFENADKFFSDYVKLQNKNLYHALISSAGKTVLNNYSAVTFNDRMKTVIECLVNRNMKNRETK